MKILWFTNNTVNLKQNTTRGGWMQSLEQQVSTNNNITLYIATRSKGKTIQKITKQKTTYFLIPDKRNLFQKRIDLLLNKEPIDFMLKQYLNVIDDIKPDIIHVFGTEMEYGLISGLTKIPVVIHIQGILNPYYYHLKKIHIPFLIELSSQNIIDYIRGNTIQNGLKIFKKRVHVEKKIFKTCRYFMGRTDWDKQIVNLLSPKAQYFHCEEMIRQFFFNSNWQGDNTKTIHIVSTISNALYKGHETITATSLILKNAKINFKWHIIGLNKKNSSFRIFYKKKLKLLSDNLIFHGELKEKDLINILQNSDIYVHPSHIENSSNSICEAMAIGMPVIAINTGGTPTIIKHSVNGVLVPDNDPYYLASKIIDSYANNKKYIDMGNNAKKIAGERHKPEVITKNLYEIYNKIIKSNASKK